MKIGAREKKIIIILAGALIFAATYFFLFQKMQEQNDLLKGKINTLNKQLKELNIKISHENEYVAQTNAMQNYIKDTLYRFPSYMQVEDGIMNVVDLEHEAEVNVTTLNVADPMLITVERPKPPVTGEVTTQSETAVPTVRLAGSVSDRYELYTVTTTVNYEATYSNLKGLIDDIVRTDENPRSMGTLSATFDNATGILSGSIDYNTFFISGLEKDYTAPYIPPIGLGTNNPFGTIEQPGGSKDSQAESQGE